MVDKDDWFCSHCAKGDGSPYFNFGYRRHCYSCNLAKGKCHLSNAPKQSPSQRKQPAGGQVAKPGAWGSKGRGGKGKGSSSSESEKLKLQIAKLKAEKSQWQKEQRQLAEPNEMDTGEAADEENEKDNIHYWRKLREVHREYCKPDDNAEVMRCSAEIDRITKELHRAKPASQQIRLDEREIQRLEKKIEAQKSKCQALEDAVQEAKKAQAEHLERIASNEAKLEEARRKKRED